MPCWVASFPLLEGHLTEFAEEVVGNFLNWPGWTASCTLYHSGYSYWQTWRSLSCLYTQDGRNPTALSYLQEFGSKWKFTKKKKTCLQPLTLTVNVAVGFLGLRCFDCSFLLRKQRKYLLPFLTQSVSLWVSEWVTHFLSHPLSLWLALIPSANQNKLKTVHLYCLIISWLALILHTIFIHDAINIFTKTIPNWNLY